MDCSVHCSRFFVGGAVVDAGYNPLQGLEANV